MNLAALVQSQTLATLLQALSPTTELVPGQTVEARLLSLAADGTAIAQIGDASIALVLAGPEGKQAALTPGATLVLRIDPGGEPGVPRATLIDVRPAPATAQPATLPPANGQAPGPGTSAGASTALPSATLRAALPLDGPASRASAATAQITPQPVATAAPSPRAAAGPLLGAALASQDGLAPLFANLRGLADGSVSLNIPKPLLRLADGVLAQAFPAERRPLTPDLLKDAVQRSGLFLEARQSQGQPAAPQADLKAGLLALREALQPLVEALTPPATKARPGEQPADFPPAQARPAPPRRDGPLALQPIAEPTLTAGEKPLAIVETLLEQTDAALDRMSLSQYASLPLEGARADAAQSQRWLTELPLAFQAGTAILPLQIEKEPPRRDAAGVQGPLWRVRFALDVEPMGPLQGVVTLQGRSVAVTLWAEREDTSRMLRGAAPGLEAALVDARFENGAIDIHTGQPRVMQATAGQFLDRTS